MRTQQATRGAGSRESEAWQWHHTERQGLTVAAQRLLLVKYGASSEASIDRVAVAGTFDSEEERYSRISMNATKLVVLGACIHAWVA